MGEWMMTTALLKRILIISNRYYPHYKGGYGLRCKSITDELLRRGYDVQVLTSVWRAANEEPDTQPTYRRLHIAEPGGGNTLARRWQHAYWAYVSRLDYRAACQTLAHFKPQLVYVWNMGLMSLSPVYAAQQTAVPLVFDLGDYWLLQRYYELYREAHPLKKWYRLAVHAIPNFNPLQFEHILTNSHVLKQRHVEAGFPADHIHVIPRGLQPEFMAHTPAPLPTDDVIKLLYAGRVVAAKGAHLAVETVAQLRQQGHPVSLDIVGNGDSAYLAQLQTQIQSLGVQDAVSLKSAVPQKTLLQLYREYHAVLLPSVWVEPFGGIALEAMAQGTCVIASNRGGPAEIITHNHNGILVEPEDPAAMARAALELVANPCQMRQLRAAALQTVQQDYTLEKIGDQVETYLNTVYRQHQLHER